MIRHSRSQKSYKVISCSCNVGGRQAGIQRCRSEATHIGPLTSFHQSSLPSRCFKGFILSAAAFCLTGVVFAALLGVTLESKDLIALCTLDPICAICLRVVHDSTVGSVIWEAVETNLHHFAWFSFWIIAGCKHTIKMFLCLPKVVEYNIVTEFWGSHTLCCYFSTYVKYPVVISPKSYWYYESMPLLMMQFRLHKMLERLQTMQTA